MVLSQHFDQSYMYVIYMAVLVVIKSRSSAFPVSVLLNSCSMSLSQCQSHHHHHHCTIIIAAYPLFFDESMDFIIMHHLYYLCMSNLMIPFWPLPKLVSLFLYGILLNWDTSARKIKRELFNTTNPVVVWVYCTL